MREKIFTSWDLSGIAPPILVMGYMHSGTTLLQHMMGNHPSIFIAFEETSHFAYLENTKRQFPDLKNEQTLREYLYYLILVVYEGYQRVNFSMDGPLTNADLTQYGITEEDIKALLAMGEGNPDHTAVFSMTYDYLTIANGRERWLDKLPGYVTQIDQIIDALPGAKVIELIRDPRDILVSKKKRLERGGSYDPLWDSLAWKSAVRSGDMSRIKNPERILRIRYEDLVNHPESTTRKICDFLDMKFDDAMLEVTWINSTTASTQAVEKGIGTAAIGKWQRQLTDVEVMTCQQVTKQELHDNGYHLIPASASDYLKLPAVLTRSSFEFFGRLYRRWRLGGNSFLFNVLSNYRLLLSRLVKQ